MLYRPHLAWDRGRKKKIDCGQTVMGLPPATSAVFLTAK
jgi:hypothetical protein